MTITNLHVFSFNDHAFALCTITSRDDTVSTQFNACSHSCPWFCTLRLYAMNRILFLTSEHVHCRHPPLQSLATSVRWIVHELVELLVAITGCHQVELVATRPDCAYRSMPMHRLSIIQPRLPASLFITRGRSSSLIFLAIF